MKGNAGMSYALLFTAGLLLGAGLTRLATLAGVSYVNVLLIVMDLGALAFIMVAVTILVRQHRGRSAMGELDR